MLRLAGFGEHISVFSPSFLFMRQASYSCIASKLGHGGSVTRNAAALCRRHSLVAIGVCVRDGRL